MRAVVQRVANATVTVNGNVTGAVGNGLLVLLGVGRDDAEPDADYLAEKIAGLRIFHDDRHKMNRSVLDVHGEILVISQFTLYGDVRRGKRPSFTSAAPPDRAARLYEHFVQKLKSLAVTKVATGEFQATMDVALVNHGPVTILLDSKKTF